MTAQLIRYDAARKALAEAHRVDEVKDIRDKAEALAAYSRQAKDTEMVEWATEIKVRAERKAGQLLKEMAEKGERATDGKPKQSNGTTVKPTLSDLGISRDQSSRYQKLADMDERDFETAVETAKAVSGEVTTAFLLRQQKEKERPVDPKTVDASVKPAPVDPVKKSKIARRSEIFSAIETLGTTDVVPADYQGMLDRWQWYHVENHLDAAISFLSSLKSHWRKSDAA